MIHLDEPGSLEQLLRDTLRAVAATTPAQAPPRAVRWRALFAIAAAAVLVLGGVATLAALRGDARAPSSVPLAPSSDLAAVPASDPDSPEPMVLSPGGLVGLQMGSGTVVDLAGGTWEGAMTAPFGVIGVTVNPYQCGSVDVCPAASGDTRVLGGNAVSLVDAVSDEAAAGTSLYVVTAPCIVVAVAVPGSIGAWDSQVVDLFSRLAIDDGAVTVAVPDGWASLGAGAAARQYQIDFDAEVDGVSRPFVALGRFGVNVGGFLGSLAFGPPRATTIGGSPAWLMSGSDTMGGGWTFVALEHGGTASIVGAEGVTDEQLVDVVARMRSRPLDAVIDPASVTPSDTSVSARSDRCEVSLDISASSVG